MNWNFLQTLRGSFSAVSTPILASKYSLESSRRDLHNALLCTVLQSQNDSQKSSTFFRECKMNFRFFFHVPRRILQFFLRFFMKFCPDFATNSRKEWRVSLFQSNLRKQIRKLPKLLKSVNIIHYCSLLFIIVHYYSLLFIIIHYYSLLFIIIHYYSLLFIIIHLCP